MAISDISLTKFHEWLNGDDDSRMCLDIPENACRQQPRKPPCR